MTQVWNEQRIDARFADINHLQFPAEANDIRVPYDPSLSLSTLVLVSDAQLQSQLHPAPGSAKASRAAAISTALASLGFHKLTSTAHIEKMLSPQCGELMHRRLYLGTAKLRALRETCSDATKNLTSVPANVTCVHCTAANITKASHSGHLNAPAATPGARLHVDIKGPFVNSIGGKRYAIFFIDETTRYVWVEFMTNKSEAIAATARVIARFNAEVGVPDDDNGKPLERPKVLSRR